MSEPDPRQEPEAPAGSEPEIAPVPDVVETHPAGAEPVDPDPAPIDPGAGEPAGPPTPEEQVVAEDAADPSGAPVSAPPSVRPPHWRRVRTLTALTLVLALTTALFAYLWQSGPEVEVREVSTRVARNLVNFDYRTIDADVRAIRADATGAFLQQFEEALAGSVTLFRDAIVEAEGRSTGSVEWTTVGTLSDERAMAVVQVTQSVSNRQTPDPVTEPRTMRLSLVRTASGWKVDDISILGV